MKLQLNRPLVFFDLETTGLNIATDRIVEISYYKLFPDASSQCKTYRVKPTELKPDPNAIGSTIEVQMHISEGASAVHGIYDQDLVDCPTFKEIAPEIAEVLQDSDIAGYNSNHFDIPLLAEEFLRVGINIDIKNKKMIDVFTIFQRNEPRNLSAAYRFYCNKNLEDAHSAAADTHATYEVLKAQLDHYPDVLENDVKFLSEYSCYSKNVDFAGRIVYNEQGIEVFNFGKYKGISVEEVLLKDPGYYGWILNGDFTLNTKNVLTKIKLRSTGMLR